MHTIITILLGGLSLMAISLERTYRRIPLKELKRRARKGDELANILYRAVSYGPSLGVVLWLLIGITNTAFFIVLTKTSPTWFAVVGCLAIIWFGYFWLPSREVSKFGTWIAKSLAPFFGWLLNYIHPVVNKVGRTIDRKRNVVLHSGLYEKQDLVDLIERQKVVAHNRIDHEELEMVKHVLTFGDKIVKDFLTPRRVVKSVAVDETVGPILLDELHESGYSRFPVYDGKKNNIVGLLYLRDLIGINDKKTAKEVMRKDVVYIHEDQSLYDVLKASVKTRKQLFIVVNTFEEYVGVISLEDVLEQALGQRIIDEFDKYEDLREVAASQAKEEHEDNDHAHPDKYPKSSEA